MTKIYDVRDPCSFSGKKVFFDTNVWININGFDPRPEFRVYSDFYASLLKKDNDVVVVDLLLGEFFNRCCKTQHKICLESKVTEEKNFKRFRVSAEFKEYAESVRDTCLNLVDDCIFDKFEITEEHILKIIIESSQGRLDYNDIVFRDICQQRGYILVTHDRDFTDCGIEVATANRRILAKLK